MKTISEKPAMNLSDTQAVISYWEHANHGKFNLELYEKILKAKQNEIQTKRIPKAIR